jgi:hypothetical protein
MSNRKDIKRAGQQNCSRRRKGRLHSVLRESSQSEMDRKRAT